MTASPIDEAFNGALEEAAAACDARAQWRVEAHSGPLPAHERGAMNEATNCARQIRALKRPAPAAGVTIEPVPVVDAYVVSVLCPGCNAVIHIEASGTIKAWTDNPRAPAVGSATEQVGVAQSVEHEPLKFDVSGSSPDADTTQSNTTAGGGRR